MSETPYFTDDGSQDWSVLLTRSCGTWTLDDYRRELAPVVAEVRRGGYKRIKLQPGNMTSYDIVFIAERIHPSELIICLLNVSHRSYVFPLCHELHPSYISTKLGLSGDAAVIAACHAVIREALRRDVVKHEALQ